MANCTTKVQLISKANCQIVNSSKNEQMNSFLEIVILKVQTFWETNKIWKNLPHGFDKSADLLSQNHEEDFFKLCVLLKKSELYHHCWKILLILVLVKVASKTHYITFDQKRSVNCQNIKTLFKSQPKHFFPGRTSEIKVVLFYFCLKWSENRS